MSAKQQQQQSKGNATAAGGGGSASALPLYATKQESAGANGATNERDDATGPYVDAGVYRYERDRKSHEFFSPGPHSTERTVKAPSAIFNLASTIIGGGILSLPYAFEKCGLVLAFVFMIVSAVASNFSLYVIVSCSRRGGATTYEEIVRKALGPKAGLITVTLLVLLTFLTMVAYVILMKDLVSSLGEQFLFARAISTAEQNMLTIVCIALVSPVLFAKSMDALRYTSIFSLCAVFLLAIAVAIRSVQSLQSADGNVTVMNSESVSIKLFPSNWRDPVFAFPIISISFLCHFNVLPVYRELHKPTRHRLKKIVSATMFSTWAFYMVVATMGYLFAYRLPGGVKDDILNNFSINDSLINVGRLGLLVTIMMNLPLIMQPCRMNTIRLGKYVSGFMKTYKSRSSNGEDIALLTTPTAMHEAVTPAVRNQNVFHIALTIAIICGVVALALVLPGVAVVWNMVGSTVGILISYVLPCVSYIIIRKNRERTDRRKVTAWIILVVGSIMCVACTLQAFKLFNIQIEQPVCSHLAEKKRPRTTQEPRALYESQAAPLKQEKASAMTDKHAAPPPASFSMLLTVDPPASTAPTSANAPLSTGPYVDTGVYRYERNRKSHEFFSPGPHSKERTATAPSAVFNLVSTIIGGGILSLPYAFDKCGLVLGFLFMVISAAASNFSLYVIVSCSRRGGATTYEEVVRKALGPKAGLVAVTLLVMLTFLTMVAYVILIKDLVGSLSEHFLFARAVTVVEKNVLTIICIALVSPVLFTKSMDALRFTSIFSLVSVLVLAIAITIRAVYSIGNNDAIDTLRPDPIEIKLFPSDWRDPVYAFPIISVSFLCHFNVLPVYRELHKPTRQRLKKIVSATMVSTWVFYMIVGTMGYLFAYQLPGGVKDDILNNFDGSDALVNVGRLGLLVTIMLSMPLIMQPCRLNILRLANYVRGFAKLYRSTSLNGEDIRLLTTPTAAATPRDAVRRGPQASRTAKDAIHVTLTVVLISGAVALALVLPGVAVVWNMMGSTVGILISYVLPCISYVAIRKKKPTSDARKLTAWGVFLASSVMCVACTFQAFASLV